MGCLAVSQQFLYAVFCLFEVESVHDVLHQDLYLVVAEVPYTAFVGVVYRSRRIEPARFYLQPYLFVGIAEGCSGEGAAIYLLYTEHQAVSFVVEDVFVYCHVGHHHRYHVQAISQFVENTPMADCWLSS